MPTALGGIFRQQRLRVLHESHFVMCLRNITCINRFRIRQVSNLRLKFIRFEDRLLIYRGV
jgi:hypothetical protein